MIAGRSFASPATQCLRVAHASRPWVPAIRPTAHVGDLSIACTAPKDNAYVLVASKTQLRSYSIPYEDKIAKFKGKKGSDVCAEYLHGLSRGKRKQHSYICRSRAITQ